jgi:TonB family protein
MTAARTSQCLAFVLMTWMPFQSTSSASGDELARAKDLYLSAAYDEALAVLDRLQGEPAGESTTEVAQYRVFCLLALERRDEAKKAIEAIVNADPFYRPSEAQTSPRIRGVFQDIRRSLLPAVVQRTYADAKAAFDRKEPQAAGQFDKVIALLDDPDLQGSPALADLRTVVTAFRDLSKAMASPPPAPAAPPPAAAAPAGSTTAAGRGDAPAPASSASTPRAGSAPARDGDPGVVAPVTVSQVLPRWSPLNGLERTREYSGTIEVTIDEQGNVIAAAIRETVNARYDVELLRVARTWKYKPAMKDGAPVRYAKLVEVQLRPPQLQPQ